MRTAKFVGLTFLAFFLLGANSCNPVVGFNSDLLNEFAGILISCLPILALIFSIAIPKRLLTKIVLPILLFPISGIMVLGCVWRFLAVTPSERIQMDRYWVRLYVTDGGALDAPSIEARQEMPDGSLAARSRGLVFLSW
jgi:hypothetical protein